jgi:hypothetical protein
MNMWDSHHEGENTRDGVFSLPVVSASLERHLHAQRLKREVRPVVDIDPGNPTIPYFGCRFRKE